MQNPARPQPLTLSQHHHRHYHHHHANRQLQQEDAAWSSDSDSGITVDSHSPPSKSTPDSGIGGEQLSWNLPPPPPSLLSDDPPPPPTIRMSTRAGTTRAGLQVASPEDSEAERRRQQDYVRNTLLEYERQKLLQEERGGGVFYSKDADPDRPGRSPNIYANQGTSSSGGSGSNAVSHPFDEDPTSQSMANDYVPCQMARKLHHHEQGDVSDAPHSHVTYQDIAERFSADDFFPPGDEGYGTDSRSNTTGSLASPLSSSLSSLTTDSSASLNGSQRGGLASVGGNGSGSARTQQPVASSGRLVIGKRGMLVKRRDLPQVERTDAVTLEDRLRALTTIQEEDPSAGNSHQATSSPGSQKKEAVTQKVDPRSSGSRSGSGSVVSRDGQTYPEGLYSVISKRPNHLRVAASSSRPVTASREGGGSDRGLSDGGDFGSASLHRAVPVTVQSQGEDPLSRHSVSSSEKRTSSDSSAKSGNGEGRSEVRFKAGGGGVKLNDSGQFEIDYSYYMKGSPSESNDEVNTYSPTSTHTQFDEAFREGDSMPPRRRTAPRSPKTHPQPEEAKYPRWSDFTRYTTQDLSEGAGTNPDGSGGISGNASSHIHDQNYAAETEHVYVNVGAYDSRHTSMPNLSVHPHMHPHPHPHPRRHSGDAPIHEERHSQDGGSSPQSILRRNPTPGSGYPSSKRAGHGDRNSCDVGSLYHQTDLSHTFPPPSSQGVAADRLSLNLGDLPRIHEQLRATSEMLLSSGKRHQFASSSDIYRLFQGGSRAGGGGGGGSGGFAQGRQPPHRRSFHDFTSSSSPSTTSATPPLHSLAEVRSRVKANTSASSNSSRPGVDQSQTAPSAPGFSPRLSGQGPLRADHNISVPPDTVSGHARYGSGREHGTGRAPSRHVYGGHEAASSAPSSGGARGSRDPGGATLKERLDRGQQFATDVIQGDEGEQLSTLV